jgi:hypothetical protein
VNDVLRTANPAEDYIGTGNACTFMAVVKVNSAPAPGTYVWDDPCLFVTENSATIALGISSSGVAFGVYTSGGPVQTSYVSLSAGYHVIQARMDGTDARVRVDGGTWQTVAATDIASDPTNLLVVGSDLTAAAAALDGDVQFLAVIDQALSNAELDALNSWALVEFGLVSAQTVTSFGLVWRAIAGASAWRRCRRWGAWRSTTRASRRAPAALSGCGMGR